MDNARVKRVCHKMGVILWILLVISFRWTTLKANDFDAISNLTLIEDQYSKLQICVLFYHLHITIITEATDAHIFLQKSRLTHRFKFGAQIFTLFIQKPEA